MPRRMLAYFVVLGGACAVALTARLPYLPLAAFVLLEGAFTLVERRAERRRNVVEIRPRAGADAPRAVDRAA